MEEEILVYYIIYLFNQHEAYRNIETVHTSITLLMRLFEDDCACEGCEGCVCVKRRFEHAKSVYMCVHIYP